MGRNIGYKPAEMESTSIKEFSMKPEYARQNSARSQSTERALTHAKRMGFQVEEISAKIKDESNIGTEKANQSYSMDGKFLATKHGQSFGFQPNNAESKEFKTSSCKTELASERQVTNC